MFNIYLIMELMSQNYKAHVTPLDKATQVKLTSKVQRKDKVKAHGYVASCLLSFFFLFCFCFCFCFFVGLAY